MRNSFLPGAGSVSPVGENIPADTPPPCRKKAFPPFCGQRFPLSFSGDYLPDFLLFDERPLLDDPLFDRLLPEEFREVYWLIPCGLFTRPFLPSLLDELLSERLLRLPDEELPLFDRPEVYWLRPSGLFTCPFIASLRVSEDSFWPRPLPCDELLSERLLPERLPLPPEREPRLELFELPSLLRPLSSEEELRELLLPERLPWLFERLPLPELELLLPERELRPVLFWLEERLPDRPRPLLT